jgi:hypothetical protein
MSEPEKPIQDDDYLKTINFLFSALEKSHSLANSFTIKETIELYNAMMVLSNMYKEFKELKNPK